MTYHYQHETEWVMPDSFPDLSDALLIAIDLETYDPGLNETGAGWATGNGYIIGIAVAVEGASWYFPIRHANGGNLDARMALRWLADVCSNPNCTYVFHNAMYDVGWLRREGIEIVGTIADTMVAAPLLDENRFSYSLNNLGFDYLNERKDERALREAAKEMGLNPKSEMYKLPAHFVGRYAEQDAALTLRLWIHLRGLIVAEEMSSIFDLEMRVLKVCLAMRARGVRVNLDKAERVKHKLHLQEASLLERVRDETGVDVNVWAAASVAKVFDHLNIPYPRTPKSGAPSFTKNFLATHPHPLAKAIVKARELNKARTTFIDSITKHTINGRIHADIHQLRSDEGGTVTGRFSYSNPNLQQIPARDGEISPLIRGLFIPEEGCQWGSFDYSSQEPRIVVHYSQIMDLDGAGKFTTAYHEDPRTDFHQLAADIVGVPRKQAKTINLGLFYGMGVNKLGEQLGLDINAAKDLFKTYHDKVPFVRGLTEAVAKTADKRGVIRTLLGRRCRFGLWEPKTFGVHKGLPLEEARNTYGETTPLKRAYTYKALNRLIQGSAADQTKKAMVDLYEAGILPMIQIHDELALSVESKEQGQRIMEIMQNCVELHVPSVVDAELGPSWGEATLSLDDAFKDPS
jgi:DNA polymerase I-like protein with 3'-5' exonuclease and polymerase domains